MKHFSLTYIFALALAFFFVACGDDDSSFAPRDDESSSSIEEESSSSSVTLSGASAESKGSSSSSVRSSSSAEPALSSAEGGEDLSSSSAKSFSSVASSSSAKSSSSKTQNPWGTTAEWQPFNLADYKDAYKEFTDSRDDRVYKYLEINGEDVDGHPTSVKVMVENINVGKMVDGNLDLSDDAQIEKYCYDNDTLICHYYGGLYQWAEMMQLPSECNTKSCADQIKPNHQGICPDGWRLLTYDDFYIILHSDANESGIKGLRSTFGFGGNNESGYSLVGAGYNWNYTFLSLTEGTYWFYPEESDENPKKGVGSYTYDSATTVERKGFYLKKHGFSVRCVMAETQAE